MNDIKEIKMFVNIYRITKHLYQLTSSFVYAYNFMRKTNFSVEQLEKYLLLIE